MSMGGSSMVFRGDGYSELCFGEGLSEGVGDLWYLVE